MSSCNNKIVLQLLLSQLELHPKSWRISLLRVGPGLEFWLEKASICFFCWKIYVKRWCFCWKYVVFWTFGSGIWDGFCLIIMKMHEVMLNICRKKKRWFLWRSIIWSCHWRYERFVVVIRIRIITRDWVLNTSVFLTWLLASIRCISLSALISVFVCITILLTIIISTVGFWCFFQTRVDLLLLSLWKTLVEQVKVENFASLIFNNSTGSSTFKACQVIYFPRRCPQAHLVFWTISFVSPSKHLHQRHIESPYSAALAWPVVNLDGNREIPRWWLLIGSFFISDVSKKTCGIHDNMFTTPTQKTTNK